MRTYANIAKLLVTTISGTFLAFIGQCFAAEPLHGPEIGQSWWSEAPDTTSSSSAATRERRADIDLPIPTAIGSAMPFATFRYMDSVSSVTPRYRADQQVGLGLMHHSAEGDPAWRLDVARGGVWASTPSFWVRAIYNLAKPFAWLKLRPSDSVFSWVGVNTIQKKGTKTLIIPELAWKRDGTDGLAVDLVAPKHFLLGFRNSRFGLLAGAEQSIVSYSTSAGDLQTADWTIRRIARIKLIATLSNEFIASVSALKPWGPSSNNKAFGAEVSLGWNPNP